MDWKTKNRKGIRKRRKTLSLIFGPKAHCFFSLARSSLLFFPRPASSFPALAARQPSSRVTCAPACSASARCSRPPPLRVSRIARAVRFSLPLTAHGSRPSAGPAHFPFLPRRARSLSFLSPADGAAKHGKPPPPLRMQGKRPNHRAPFPFHPPRLHAYKAPSRTLSFSLFSAALKHPPPLELALPAIATRRPAPLPRRRRAPRLRHDLPRV